MYSASAISATSISWQLEAPTGFSFINTCSLVAGYNSKSPSSNVTPSTLRRYPRRRPAFEGFVPTSIWILCDRA